MAHSHNGIFAKINKYYDAITYGLLQVMHFNDLCLLFCSQVRDLNTSRLV